MVLMTTRRKYAPFNTAGRAFSIILRKNSRFSTRSSSEKSIADDAGNIATIVVAIFDLTGRELLHRGDHVGCHGAGFGGGHQAFGTEHATEWRTTRIWSGEAMATSKSIQPPLTFSTSSRRRLQVHRVSWPRPLRHRRRSKSRGRFAGAGTRWSHGLVGRLFGIDTEGADHFDRLVKLGLLVATQGGNGFGGGVDLGLDGFIDFTVGLGSFAGVWHLRVLHRDTHGTGRTSDGAGGGVHFERVHVGTFREQCRGSRQS